MTLSHAARGTFGTARSCLERAYALGWTDRVVRYTLKMPAYRHVRRGRRYAAQGFTALTLRDLEAALVQDPSDRSVRSEHERLPAGAALEQPA